MVFQSRNGAPSGMETSNIIAYSINLKKYWYFQSNLSEY